MANVDGLPTSPPGERVDPGRRSVWRVVVAGGIALIVCAAVALAVVRPWDHSGTVGTVMQRSASTWTQDHPQTWAWMQSHWDEVTVMHQYWGDTAWMQTNLADWRWMQDHWGEMDWIHLHWQGMEWMHASGMMGGSGSEGMRGS
jgi:hypothetical protein